MLLASIVLISLSPVVASTPETIYFPAATGILLSIDFRNGTVLEYSDLEGTNVYEVTNSTTPTDAEWYGDLVYVTSIAGVAEDVNANIYWQYWVNGELGNVAANKYTLQDNDVIEWGLPSNTTDTTPVPTDQPFDVSLVIGGTILGVVAMIALVVLSKRHP
jgi:hypothetical protein